MRWSWREMVLRVRHPPAAVRALFLAVHTLTTNNGTQLAGHMAFMGFLALFPFLIFLTSLGAFIGDDKTPLQVIGFLFDYLPTDVVLTLKPAINDVLGRPRGGLLTLSIIVTLWVASSGVEALRSALNNAYGVAKPRPFWYRRLQNILVVLCTAVIAFILSFVVIFTPLLVQLLNHLIDASEAVAEFFYGRYGEEVTFQIGPIWTVLRYAFSLAVMVGGLVALHRFLPNRAHKTAWVLPGALLTTVLWLVLANLFTRYLATIPSYSMTYGPLGGAVVSLLFFYVTALIFVLGGEYNAALHRIAGRENVAKHLPHFRRPRLRIPRKRRRGAQDAAAE